MIYAEKHFSIIERVWKEDSQLDYLSGNAGAIVVAVMLYKETGNLKYYEIAADMEKDLWKKGQETGNGYGWRLKGTDGPLAGMSHGNSGFLMAYAALYECNHKAEYADKIQLLLRYEGFSVLRESRKLEGFTREFRGKLHECMVPWGAGNPAFTNETGRAVS